MVGIETKFEDLRAGGVLFLPQRIAVFAQGETSVAYSETKLQITSAKQVGDACGYNSQAYVVARELFPANGDGVGTIPVTLYPLVDDGSGVAAAGDVTPSGTATDSGEYRLLIAGRLSSAFVIPIGAVDVTRVVGDMGIAVQSVLGMPVKATFTYGTVVSVPDGGNTGDGTCTALSVTGEAAPGDFSLICTAAVANGGVFSLIDPSGRVVDDAVTMTPGAGAATVIDTAGVGFTLTDAAADFIVGDQFTITVPATKVDLTAGWKAANTNDITISIVGPSAGVVFAVSAMAGGLVNPSITSALAQVGDVWESMLLNSGQFDDTIMLDEFAAFGEGRWGQLTRKPCMSFVGCNELAVADAIVVAETRTTDRTNVQLNAPGSVNLPYVIAARQLARIAKVANNNPPKDYGSQRATGLLPGLDGEQWTYNQRDQAVKGGVSTIEVKDSVINISDVVTMYAPVGEEPPAYRYTVDIVKLQTIIFNLNLIFANTEWDGAPLIPDDQPTVNPAARKPKDAKAQVASVIDSLGLNAIISDPETAKESIEAAIDSGNPKRLNVSCTVQLSGNAGIISVDLNFGFFFGSATIVA